MIMENSSNYGKIPTQNGKRGFETCNPPYYIRTSDETKVAIFDSPQGDSDGETDYFYKSLRNYLIIGKVIGLLPFSGVFGGNLTFRRTSLTSIITHVIFVGLVFNMALGIVASMRAPKRNALEIAESIRATLYYIWGTFIYFTFLHRGNQFIDIITSWNRADIAYSKKDTTLRRDVALISGVILTSAFLENGVLHLEYINSLDTITGDKHGNKTDNMTWLEGYYWRANLHWANVLNYNCFFAIISFVQHKWILYAWNYMDISIAIFGRAMYFRFKILMELAEERLLGSQERRLDNDNSGICQDPNAWIRVVRDHQSLCRLLMILENFFSPLIFVSYAVNMFYICLQLLDGLTSELSSHSIVHSIYAPWSFVHLIVRTYIVSICCARINVYAHRIRIVFEGCPDGCYSKDVSRFDKRVTAGPDIGLTGLGCFVVTKPFILSMLSVIFTLEIVLLQCVPPSQFK